MGSYNYTISIGHLGEQLTLNQWVLGSSPRWCTKFPVTGRYIFARCGFSLYAAAQHYMARWSSG
mgnify:CR=1 FL=1